MPTLPISGEGSTARTIVGAVLFPIFTVHSRTGGTDIVNVPNWPSSTDRSTVQINDFD